MDRLAELRRQFTEEPFAKAMGATLEELGTGRAVISCRPHRLLTIAVGGVVQGGVLASLVDYAGVYAAMSVLPEGHTPASALEIRFLRPVKEGDELTATATVVNRARTRILTESAVTCRGKLMARATIEFARPRQRPAS